MSNKNRLLYILSLLYREADEEHPITITQILERLQQAGIDGNRRTIAHDLEVLSDNGFDIICNKSRQNQYFIGERHFEIAELKLLIDAVQASRFIPTKRSKHLIRKLSSFASKHQVTELNRHLYVDKQVKAENEQVIYTVDLLNAAINSHKHVSFKYYEYNKDKQKVYKHKGKVYYFSPYSLIWNNDCYYVLGFSESHDKIVKFRVELITSAEIQNKPAVPKPKNFCLNQYVSSVFQMYDAENRIVVLRCKNFLMKHIIDRFGTKIKTEVADSEHFNAKVDVAVSPTFFGWVVGFSGQMQITAPDDVKEQFAKLVQTLC